MKSHSLLLVGLLSLALAACQETPLSTKSNVSTIQVTDGIGRTLTVTPGSYQRIACVGAGALRTYSYLGDISLLCGVEDIDNPTKRTSKSPFEGVGRPYYDAYQEKFSSLPSAGKGGPMAMQSGVPLAELTALQPDLIISNYTSVDDAVKMEQATGAIVFTVSFGPQAIFDSKTKAVYMALGQTLNREERAQELLDYVRSCEEELTAMTSTIREPISAYAAGIGNWGQKDYLATHTSYPSFLKAGVKNVVTGQTFITGQGQIDITTEAWAALGPKIDKLYFDAAGIKKTLAEYQNDPHIFDGVKAVNEGEVYLLLPYNAYYTNMEFALMDTYYICQTAYPEVSSSFDFEAKEKEIYQKFLGKDMTEVEKKMVGNYGGLQKISDFPSWLAERAGQ